MNDTSLQKPGEALEGTKLAGGWTVGKRRKPKPGATGGNFSTGYDVVSDDGRHGFLKAIDISDALFNPDPGTDPARILNEMTELFIFERDLLEACRPMDRVVTAIGSGTISAGQIPGAKASPVFYLIFERADGDARTYSDARSTSEVALSLRTLHHVFVGMRQLHTKFIAHQDLKPSNVLRFNGDAKRVVSKVADLGRAFAGEGRTPELLASLGAPGDLGYAPPELLYGQCSADWRIRRLGCDLYLLGSLTVFFFSGVSMTALIQQALAPEHKWKVWRGGYEKILPYIREAFDRSMVRYEVCVEEHLTRRDALPAKQARAKEDLVRIVLELCEPDAALRGDPKSRKSNPFDLQRYVSILDRLSGWSEARLI